MQRVTKDQGTKVHDEPVLLCRKPIAIPGTLSETSGSHGGHLAGNRIAWGGLIRQRRCVCESCEVEPQAALGSLFLRCTIPLMKKDPAPKSRRRSRQPLGRKTFVYLTDEERTLVDEAAAAERRSVSSFIANAAVEAAERIVQNSRKK